MKKQKKTSKKRGFEEVESNDVVPLSEKINAMYNPKSEIDPESSGLWADATFERPKGPMIDPAKESERIFFLFFLFIFFLISFPHSSFGRASCSEGTKAPIYRKPGD
jgi:hypothetical protein